MSALRFAILASVGLGCGGHPPASDGPQVPAASRFPAARWVPERPSYLLASATVKDAQRSLGDAVDWLGMLAGFDLTDVSRQLEGLLAVDALSPDSVAALGIDLDGGIAMFSQEVSPTFVVHLTAPDQLQAFLDRQRERGLRTESRFVDGTEIFSAQLVASTKISWAVVGDWLWVHFSLPVSPDDQAAWFTSSHRPGPASWSADWQWAQSVAGKGKSALLGFVGARALIKQVVSRAPELVACAERFSPIGRIAVSIETDGHAAAAKLTIDVGAAAQRMKAALLPTPEGWAAATAKAPLAAQWNLDLQEVRGWLQPCAKAVGQDLGMIATTGLRAARATVLGFDAGDKTGSAAVSFDLVHKKWIEARLAELPGSSLRSTLERERRYGPLAGHSLSIPFGPTIEYVLGDHLVFVAVGDRLLANLVGTGQGAPGPIAAIDINPPAMSADAWAWILELAVGDQAARVTQRLMRWRDAHLAITVSGTSLVVDVSGTRR